MEGVVAFVLAVESMLKAEPLIVKDIISLGRAVKYGVVKLFPCLDLYQGLVPSLNLTLCSIKSALGSA